MNKNMIAFIKHLKQLGYSQKQIAIITKQEKTYIHRIWHGKAFQYIAAKDYVYDQNLENHKTIYDIILAAPEIPGQGYLEDNDKYYLRLLRYCQVSYEQAREIYSDRPAREIHTIWFYGADIDMRKFDSTQINIPIEDYQKFIGS